MKTQSISIDWNNVNLKDAYEREQNLLDPYDFDTLLLEVSCNVREINKETVRTQAIESIKIKYRTAIDILDSNLDNLVKEAKFERSIP